jgi:hypothetical protein
MFTHPTEGQLSLIAMEYDYYEPELVSTQLGHLVTELESSQLCPGDYIEADGWDMVTLYNVDGFKEVFVTKLDGQSWKHKWYLFDVGTKIKCIQRKAVDQNMEKSSRVPSELLPTPAFVTAHACTGLNGCCQYEKERSTTRW